MNAKALWGKMCVFVSSYLSSYEVFWNVVLTQAFMDTGAADGFVHKTGPTVSPNWSALTPKQLPESGIWLNMWQVMLLRESTSGMMREYEGRLLVWTSDVCDIVLFFQILCVIILRTCLFCYWTQNYDY